MGCTGRSRGRAGGSKGRFIILGGGEVRGGLSLYAGISTRRYMKLGGWGVRSGRFMIEGNPAVRRGLGRGGGQYGEVRTIKGPSTGRSWGEGGGGVMAGGKGGGYGITRQ